MVWLWGYAVGAACAGVGFSVCLGLMCVVCGWKRCGACVRVCSRGRLVGVGVVVDGCCEVHDGWVVLRVAASL